jgi:hypothetical protein
MTEANHSLRLQPSLKAAAENSNCTCRAFIPLAMPNQLFLSKKC